MKKIRTSLARMQVLMVVLVFCMAIYLILLGDINFGVGLAIGVTLCVLVELLWLNKK